MEDFLQQGRQCWGHPMNEQMSDILHLHTPEGTEQYDFLETLVITVVLSTVRWILTTRRAGIVKTVSSLEYGAKITVYLPYWCRRDTIGVLDCELPSSLSSSLHDISGIPIQVKQVVTL